MDSKITFGIPEVLIFGSFYLLANSLVWQGWSFFAMGIFGSFLRFSLEFQKAKAIQEKQKEVLENVEDLGKTFANMATMFGNKTNGKMH